MNHARLLLALLSITLVAVAGCDGTTPGGPCQDSCTIGEARCNAFTIEACGIGEGGCAVWISGVDCAEDALVCSDDTNPPRCLDPLGDDDDATGDDDDATGDDDDATGDDDDSTTPPETCSDGIQNQDETDADCGGTICPTCDLGDGCLGPDDCATGNCDVGLTDVCIDPATESCGDGVQNQDETDIDCGGVCGGCDLGEDCLDSTDCASGNCAIDDGDVCVSPATETCGDGIQNQDETDVDCGGATCGPCGAPSYLTDEDFETGDLTLFPYDNTSSPLTGYEWTIEANAADCYAGSYCMRTDLLHPADEVATLELALSVRQATTISFQARVNAEPNEHWFRFFIDGVEQIAVTGSDTGWVQYTFPVAATGVGGPDRVFTWEYSRSQFVDPNHVAWNEVWVDDIDMPAWNTQPGVPDRLAPWDGTTQNDATPTFQFVAEDPDFDTVTYEVQYDTDPAFSLPISSFEITSTTWVPPLAPLATGVYFWRVRSKDDSDYRWSDWSTTWTFEIDPTYEYAEVWRQSATGQFALNTLDPNMSVANDVVLAALFSYDSGWKPWETLPRTQTFTGLPTSVVVGSGAVQIGLRGDFSSSNEYAAISLGGSSLGNVNPNTTCGYTESLPVSQALMASKVASGSTTVLMVDSSFVSGGGCGFSDQGRSRILYDYRVPGTMVSPPIDFSLFSTATLWEKVQLVGSGTMTWQVLDASTGQPIPDSDLPGNAAGFTERTMHLWGVDPSVYPTIQLSVTLSGNAQLEEWRVVGNTVFEWLFNYDGDAEGWEGYDFGSTPTVSVSGGTLLFEGFAAGSDPSLQYWMPQPVDASRFTTVEVTVLTSNNGQNDDVTFLWDSNYGGFDPNRSFVVPGVFLQSFQDLTIDLTQSVTSPSQPWQGQINAIRLDPVVRFVDLLLAPDDGTFEISRIAIY